MFFKIPVVQEQYQQLDGLLKALQQATAKSGAFKGSATHRMLADFYRDTARYILQCLYIYIYIYLIYIHILYNCFSFGDFCRVPRPEETKQWPVLHALRSVWQVHQPISPLYPQLVVKLRIEFISLISPWQS